MNIKRKDNKGRILRDGESQRSDGRYMFRYTDINGKRRTVYSWQLVKTDKVPTGKNKATALRDLETDIRRDICDGVDTFDARTKTLNVCFDEYLIMKSGLKASTLSIYRLTYDKHIRNQIGLRSIISIKYSDIKILYNNLVTKSGLSLGSVSNIDKILHPIFSIAVKDGLIKTNPIDGVLSEMKRQQNWRRPKRHALSVEEQSEFLQFIKNSQWKYLLNLFVFLLGTGCRIGETISLRWCDCDFENRVIHIDHNLSYEIVNGKKRKYISMPKTPNSIRTVPMLTDVRDALIRERDHQRNDRIASMELDGYSDFVFRKANGRVYDHHSLDRILYNIVDRHNDIERLRAIDSEYKLILLPKFSVHTLRRTFCTRLCEHETNLKLIQEIMGHSDIQLTMNIYNEITEKNRVSHFEKLDEKFKLF